MDEEDVVMVADFGEWLSKVAELFSVEPSFVLKCQSDEPLNAFREGLSPQDYQNYVIREYAGLSDEGL